MQAPGPTARIAAQGGAQQHAEAERMRVTRVLQGEVDQGRARWVTSTGGQTELHLQTGEVFLLGKTSLTRLK